MTAEEDRVGEDNPYNDVELQREIDRAKTPKIKQTLLTEQANRGGPAAWGDKPVRASGGPAEWGDKPAESPKPAATPAGDTESPTSFKNLAGAAVEPLLSMGTGAAGAVAGGIGGLGAGINKAVGLSDREPGDVTRSIQSGMTYQPRTTGGQNAMKAIGAIPQAIGDFSQEAGGRTTDLLNRIGAPPKVSAGVGAAGNAAMQFLPQLLGSRAAGSAAEAAPKMIPKLTPEVSPAVKTMVDKGATLTPGQLFGGGWDRAEQAISKWPIVGAPVRGARARSFQDFNEAAQNDVLAPIKEKVPPGMVGQKAVEYVNNKLGDRYDDILEKTTGRLDTNPPNALPAPGQLGQPAPKSLRNDLIQLRQMVDGSSLPKKYKSEFGRIVDDDVIGRFTENGGLAPGEVLKQIDTNLRVLAQKKGLSDKRDINTVGLAINQARVALKQMIERENPGLAQELKATDTAYAKFKIVQKATVAAGKDGVFTPAQFERAVKAQDRTKDKRAYSEGDANMQDLAKAAREALGDSIPDSGTASQLFMAALAGGGKGLLGIPGGIAGASALAIPYSKTGTGLMQRALTGPPGNTGAAVARALPFGQNQINNPPQ